VMSTGAAGTPANASLNAATPPIAEKMPVDEPPPKEKKKKKTPAQPMADDAPPKMTLPEKAARKTAEDAGQKGTLSNCKSWAAQGECEKNPGYMAGACAGECSGRLPAAEPESKAAVEAVAVEEAAPEEAMPDERPECRQWAAQGECTRNSVYMAGACARSCAGRLPDPASGGKAAAAAAREVKSVKVDWTEPVLEPALAAAQRETDARYEQGEGDLTSRQSEWRRCEDVRPDCKELARGNLSACGEAEFMLTECRKTCRTCNNTPLISGLYECKDTNDGCPVWARSGECENNRRFMLSGCSVSCNVCQEKKVGCERRNAEPGFRSPTGLSDMFERALVDFPRFSPAALSRPTEDNPTAPYVLQFEDIISPEEAKTLIEIAGSKLERSLAGDQVSPVRTSTQYWCDDSDDCTSHPTVVKITERMMNITTMPVNHAEYFQILRYQKGEFYKQHHDQQTAHWTPQGVRVLTFFVYLSDVEEGGGTKFNDLGLTVRPKLGRAVLWPSVKSSDLLTGEQKTHHEALPVAAGVKYAANLWIHLYDFKTPSRAGICPFLGQNTHSGS